MVGILLSFLCHACTAVLNLQCMITFFFTSPLVTYSLVRWTSLTHPVAHSRKRSPNHSFQRWFLCISFNLLPLVMLMIVKVDPF